MWAKSSVTAGLTLLIKGVSGSHWLDNAQTLNVCGSWQSSLLVTCSFSGWRAAKWKKNADQGQQLKHDDWKHYIEIGVNSGQSWYEFWKTCSSCLTLGQATPFIARISQYRKEKVKRQYKNILVLLFKEKLKCFFFSLQNPPIRNKKLWRMQREITNQGENKYFKAQDPEKQFPTELSIKGTKTEGTTHRICVWTDVLSASILISAQTTKRILTVMI